MTATIADAPVSTPKPRRTRQEWEAGFLAVLAALNARWPDGVPG